MEIPLTAFAKWCASTDKRDVALVNTARKAFKKYRANFALYENAPEFYIRLILDKNEEGVLALEYPVNANNWLDYLENADLKEYQVKAIEVSLK